MPIQEVPIMFKDNPAFSSFSVNDLDKAKHFYADTLGLKVTEDYEGLSLNLKGDRQIMVYPKDNHEPATYTVLNFVVEDIETAVAALTDKGLTMEQYDFMGTNDKGISTNEHVSMAWFKDPAGNILSVLQTIGADK
jgi:catechol 2,3-dioxygenase-like lactoylglutathione lyase family enzyme